MPTLQKNTTNHVQMFAMNLASRLEVQLVSSIDIGMPTLSFKKNHGLLSSSHVPGDPTNCFC